MKKSMIFAVIIIVLAALATVSAFWCFGIAVPQYTLAEQSGSASGELIGSGIGTAVGMAYGITDGYVRGLEDGKEDGLSAETTTYVDDVKISLCEVGALEVLSASVSIRNLHEAGGGDYKNLEILFGKGVFTVDLGKAEVAEDVDGALVIKLPNPQLELYIDEEKTEYLGEYQKFPWSGSAGDGYEAYLNSRIEVDEKVQDKIAHYDQLFMQARESAQAQVELLAGSVSVEGKTVTVILPGKAGAN